tara:strand:+ start:886 stop:2316 length:1431 start_codon:yes stop_codon:yes gene_type:complete
MIKNSKIYFISNITSAIIAIFTLPIFTRFLSPEDFGILALFLIFGSITSQIISLSLGEATRKFYFDDIDFKILNFSNLTVILIIFVLFGILIFIFSEYISIYLFNDRLSSKLIFISYLSGCLIFLFSYQNILFVISERPKQYLLVNLFFNILNPLVAILILINSNLTYESRIISIILISIISTIIGFFLNLKFYKIQLSKNYIKKSIIFSGPLTPNKVVSQLNETADKYISNYFLGLSALGILSISIRIADISKLFINSFLQAWTPYFLKNAKNTLINKKKILSGFYIIISVIFISTYSLALFSEEIIKFLTVEEYYFTIKYVPIICFSIFIIHIFTSLSFNQIISTEQTGSLLKVSFLAFLINIFLNILLIPKFQIYGAIIATMISGFISGIYSFYLGQRFFPISINYSSLIKIILLYVIFNIPIFILVNIQINLFAKILLKIIIVLFLIYCLKKTKILRNNFIREIILLKNKIF